MELLALRLDNAQSADILGDEESSGRLRAVTLSRSAALGVGAGHDSFWLVLRGEAWVDCREGRLALQRSDWIALDRDSRPSLYAGTDALVLGLLIPFSLRKLLLQPNAAVVLAGRGGLSPQERRLAFRLWRQAGALANAGAEAPDATGRVRQLISFIAGLQRGFDALIDRCPGRSLERRRQVFVRMQRARLYLEGNSDRIVRIGELARLCNFSVWHFTKTYHALFGEGPQAEATRFRLRHASELLATSKLSIGEVGAACGFDNACSFARAFRVQYGTTASGYRERMRQARPPISANQEGVPRKAWLAFGT